LKKASPPVGMDVVDINNFSVMFNVKGYPLTGRIQPYGVLGFGFNVARIEDTVGMGMSDTFFDVGFRAGAGVDIYATRSLVGFLEFSYFLAGFNDLEDFNFIPIVFGLQYRF